MRPFWSVISVVPCKVRIRTRAVVRRTSAAWRPVVVWRIHAGAVGFPGTRSRQGWRRGGLDPSSAKPVAGVTLSLFKFVLPLALAMRISIVVIIIVVDIYYYYYCLCECAPPLIPRVTCILSSGKCNIYIIYSLPDIVPVFN